MPYKSQAQAGYFHTHEAELKAQGVNVGEWDRATKGMHLPKRAGASMDKFKSRPRPAEYLRGGPVQAEGKSWAKSSSVKTGDMIKQPDAFRTDAGPGAKQSYGKRGGSMGSGGTHGPSCSCSACKSRYS